MSSCYELGKQAAENKPEDKAKKKHGWIGPALLAGTAGLGALGAYGGYKALKDVVTPLVHNMRELQAANNDLGNIGLKALGRRTTEAGLPLTTSVTQSANQVDELPYGMHVTHGPVIMAPTRFK